MSNCTELEEEEDRFNKDRKLHFWILGIPRLSPIKLGIPCGRTILMALWVSFPLFKPKLCSSLLSECTQDLGSQKAAISKGVIKGIHPVKRDMG